MLWNWQLKDWPNFIFNESKIKDLELEFLRLSGVYNGMLLHCNSADIDAFIVSVLENEAFDTSEIEGKVLNRDSLHSSICKHFGLAPQKKSNEQTAEEGIAKVMTDLYKSYDSPLSHELLHKWHKWLMYGTKDLKNIGDYRNNEESMQIISGPMGSPKVHFEAPPAKALPKEMEQYISWFNKADTKLTPLLKASIGHIYFESIHPFEDGNGRIGRGLVIKSLSQDVKHPLLITLSETIQRNKRRYYDALQKCNRSLDITDWIVYFSKIILDSQSYAITLIELIIFKSKLFHKFEAQLNERQEKLLLRIFKEGPSGFQGGLSVNNYISITKTSRATATRDLQELLKLDILFKQGVLKGTRYYLNKSIKF
jgi:Fic family protein